MSSSTEAAEAPSDSNSNENNNNENNNSNENNNNEESIPAASTTDFAEQDSSTAAAAATSSMALPSKRDRLLLYTRIEGVVQQKIRTLQSLPDTRPRNWRGQTLTQYPEPSTVATRGRQVYFLRMELLPIIAASLLLHVSDLHTNQGNNNNNNSNNNDSNDDSSSTDMAQFTFMQDPVACMTLLISNFLLLSKGNYDARIRHTIKTVCVQLFQDLYGGEHVPDESAIPIEYYTPANAIYSLTVEKEKKKNHKLDESDYPLLFVKDDVPESYYGEHVEDFEKDPLDRKNRGDSKDDLTDFEELQHATESLSEESNKVIAEMIVDEKENSKQATSNANDGELDNTVKDEQANTVNDDNVDSVPKDQQTQVLPLSEESLVAELARHNAELSESIARKEAEHATATPQMSKPDVITPETVVEDDDSASNNSDDKKNSSRRCIHLQATTLQIAKERFETLEKAIATDILQVMMEQEATKQAEAAAKAAAERAAERSAAAAEAAKVAAAAGTVASKQHPQAAAITKHLVMTKKLIVSRLNKQLFVRSLQIGTVSLVVGGLFAFTGGLAAPALVAAITAFGVGSAIPAFATLTTTAALASMFGVVGGGLAAYKMKKRTDGLSDWRIRKEGIVAPIVKGAAATTTIRGLHATVCVSGWLQSKQDFQTPFGIQANDPVSENDLDTLHRFFSVHAPDKITFAKALLKAHSIDNNIIAESISGLGLTNTKEGMKRSRDEMFRRLEEKYGQDPRQLLPLAPATEPTEIVAATPLGNNMTTKPVVAEATSRLLLDEATQLAIKELLNTHVLDEQHAKEMEDIFEANHMLGQMEMMNAEMFAQMTSETLEAMKGSDHSNGIPRDVDVRQEEKSFAVNDAVVNDEAVDDEKSFGEEDENTFGEEEEKSFGEEDEEEEQVVDTPEPQAPLVMTEESLENILASSDEEEEEETTKPAGDDRFGNMEKVKASEENQTDTTNSTDGSEAGSAAANTLNQEEDMVDAQPSLISTSSMGSIGSPDKDSLTGGSSHSLNARDFTRSPEDARDELCILSTPKKMDHSLVVWDWEANYSGELYTITWETEFLLQLCKVVEVLFMEISNQVSKEVLKQTLIGGMVSAVAIPSALTTAIGVIDDPYQLISFRSEKAGVELAQCLMMSEERRPVSLVGFSFGARVIFSCMLELARHQTIWEGQEARSQEEPPSEEKVPLGEPGTRVKRAAAWVSRKARRQKGIPDWVDYKREPASIVEDVVLIGLPMRIDRKEWIACRELIAGRLVNCYNKSDWILSYMINIRCWNGVNKACGTHPIQDIVGVENYEISHLASSHGRYPLAVPHILHEVGYGEPWRREKKV